MKSFKFLHLAYFFTLISFAASFASCDDDTLNNSDNPETSNPEKFPDHISIGLESDNVAYRFDDDTAHFTIRTVPWFLPRDYEESIVAVDESGNISNACKIAKLELLSDSTWNVGVVLKKVYSANMRFGIEWADSICVSELVSIKTASNPQLSVYFMDPFVKLTFDELRNEYSAIMPTMTDFSKLVVNVETSPRYHCDSVIINGEKFVNKKEYDLSKPLSIQAWTYGIFKSYSVRVMNTGLPIVRIQTPEGIGITSKTEWISNCSMRIELPNGSVNYEDTMSMRGRGNASWTDTEKKSYALKMDEKDKILGMPKHKRWCLLANFKDRTLMRNDVTFRLASHTSQDYVIKGQFVELELNGKYRGNYYLCEQGKIGKNRISINDPDPANPGESGFLLESDAYYYEERNNGLIPVNGGFVSNVLNVPYAFKQPDGALMTPTALKKVETFINTFEQSLKNIVDPRITDRTIKQQYSNYLDVDQCIDYALIQELTGNLDFYNSYPVNGTHSMYFHIDNIDNGGKLVFGHLWDFDYMTFDPKRAQGWVGITKHGYDSEFYYYYLLNDAYFKYRFKERWNTLKGQFLADTAYIDQMADVIRLSEQCNATMPENSQNGKGWFPIVHSGGHNNDEYMSFQDAVNNMKKGLIDRWNWMDRKINDSNFPNN